MTLEQIELAHRLRRVRSAHIADEGLYSNQRRADDAVLALLVGTDFDGDDETDLETYLADLFAHMQHLACITGTSWDEVERRGTNHFEEEMHLQGKRSRYANTE